MINNSAYVNMINYNRFKNNEQIHTEKKYQNFKKTMKILTEAIFNEVIEGMAIAIVGEFIV